jgi:hypothetical protein
MRRFLAVVMTGLIGAIALPQIVAKEATIVQAQQPQAPMNWKVWTEGRGWPGPKVTTNAYGAQETHEAAGRWLWVSVTMQNTSGARRTLKDDLQWEFAEVEDTEGNIYKADWDASTMTLLSKKVEGKPFGPGESRSVRLLFDIPNNAQIAKLKISGYDSQQESREIVVNF